MKCIIYSWVSPKALSVLHFVNEGKHPCSCLGSWETVNVYVPSQLKSAEQVFLWVFPLGSLILPNLGAFTIAPSTQLAAGGSTHSL
jgi:hypothetical protein